MDPMKDHRFSSSPDWKLTNFSNIFARRVIKPLPSKQEAIILVNKAFEGFNMAFPIFDEASATAMLNYPDGGHPDPSHWACLNVVLALAHRFRSMRMMNNTNDDRDAWGYLQNALAVAPELTLLQPKLASVQALLGMAIVIQGSPNPRPFGTLISQAIRIAQSLGLHRKNRDPNLTPREVEQRKRVFWVAYYIDKEHCLKTGQPPAQDDDEMDVEMPSEMLDNTIQFGDSPEVNYFNFRVKLSLIQGQVYKRLISVKAEKQSVTRRMVEVKRLEGMLAVWRASIPIDFCEAYHVPGRGTPMIPPIIHKVILRITYFATLNTIHRFSIPIEQWRSDLQQVRDPNISNKHAPPPPSICVEEARNAITLMHVTPKGDYACIWVILHVFVSATNLLLENILSNPTQRRAPSDLKLIEPLLGLLFALAKDGKNDEVVSMYQTCGEMFEKTSRVVQEARDSGEEQRKLVEMGKQGEKESLDEFIRRIESVSGGYDVDEEVVMQGMSPGQNGLEYENMEFGFLEADTRMARLAW
jgi:predicted CopG family antitoxin